LFGKEFANDYGIHAVSNMAGQPNLVETRAFA
jgi:hypothetical protein